MPSLKSALHSAVLATRNIPPLKALYRGTYGAACSAAARSYRSVGVDNVVLHRGLTRPNWEPGVSDVDLILIGQFDESGLRSVSRTRRRLKALFPMMGDLWLGSPKEISAYLRWGGLRAAEDFPDWRALSGALPSAVVCAESPIKRRHLNPWVWSLISYMEVSRRRLSTEPPRAKDEADVAKLSADARRYADAALSGLPPAPRCVRPRVPKSAWLETALELNEASRAAAGACLTEPAGKLILPRPDDEEARHLSDLKRRAGCSAVVVDPPYHLYLILEDSAGQAEHERAAAAARKAGYGVPLVLTRSAWSLCIQSSYLGAALGLADAGPGEAAPALPHAFSQWRTRGVGDASIVGRLPAALAWETAAEASSWMALWWRALWIEKSFPNRFVLFHLYTRALSLTAALQGRPPGAFCGWEAVLAGARAADPEEDAFLKSLSRYARQEPAECLDAWPRSSLDAAHYTGIDRMMQRLGAAVSEGPCRN